MRNIFFNICVFIVGGFLLVGCSANKSANNGGATGGVIDPYAAEYNLFRVGDILSIQLSGVPISDLATYQVKVDDDGNISMPHIGNVKAAGVSAAELQNKIETLYKANRIYTNPTVTVVFFQERYVSVSGEVRLPTRLLYNKDLTVLGAIAATGGFTEYADRGNIKLIRGGTTTRFDARAALKDPKKDMPLLPNDIVHVERTVF